VCQSGRWWRWDDRAADQASIKALVGVSCFHGRQLLYLHGVGSCSPTRISGGAHVVCHGPRTSQSRSEVVRGGDFSCEAETFVGIPLVGNWLEMQPTGRRLDVLPVWVLTRVLSLPRPESWPWHWRSWPSRCQWCWVTLCLRKIFSLLKGALIRDLVSSRCPGLMPGLYDTTRIWVHSDVVTDLRVSVFIRLHRWVGLIVLQHPSCWRLILIRPQFPPRFLTSQKRCQTPKLHFTVVDGAKPCSSSKQAYGWLGAFFTKEGPP
jgi:hypothetical protein